LEAASKKRGRPRSSDVEHEAHLRPTGIITSKTHRAYQNRLLFFEAVDALEIGPNAPAERQARFRHLVDWPAADRYERGACKFGATAELGRAAKEFGSGPV
jgi:hypothetical protein